MSIEPEYHTLGAKAAPLADVVRYPFPKEPMARRRLFLDSLDLMLELYRNEGMTDLELRDGLKAKVAQLNESMGDPA